MAEGEGSDAKSGPSDWRKAPQRPASWHEEDLARRGSVVSLNSPDYDDPEEVLREEEAEGVERNLSPGPSSAPSRPAYTSQGSRLKLATLNGLHTSASDFFSVDGPPPLLRSTTYSSLPPSPRHEDLEFSFKADIRAKELEDVLHRLREKEPIPSQNPPEDDAEEFWPAESRRDTIDGDGDEHKEESDEIPLSPVSPNGHIPRPSTPRMEGLSLWDLLRDEVGAEEWEGWVVDGKWERITNFLAVPWAVEKVTLFGALLCLDGFLYNFTILPFRATFAAARLVRQAVNKQPLWPIPPTHLHSLLRMLLLFIPTTILLFATDASKMYHTVRGQDTIKLYVIFNALEIADRLCCAFGQDVLDTLFAKETFAPATKKRGRGRRRQQARPLFFLTLALGYVLAHTLIYFYMLVSLNVAINSYDYTLLSLLISNQFVEIKGSVFKKFEKENLFQIMCADIVERFQLSLMLSVIALRNMIEMAGSDIAFLPQSFVRGKSLVDAIMSPVLFVIVSEMLVDWLKHAFITKFNHVRASVYERFTDVLAKDVLQVGSFASRPSMKDKKYPILLDQSPLVTRRMGFASIPLACLVLRISVQAIGMLSSSSHHSDAEMSSMGFGAWAWTILKWAGGIGVGLSAWGCLIALKILLGLSLLSFSALRQAGMDEREAADTVNDFGRQPVGESKEETEYNKQTSRYLSQDIDDLPEYQSPTSAVSPTVPFSYPPPVMPKPKADKEQAAAGGKKSKKWKLEEVERWTMVKRIW